MSKPLRIFKPNRAFRRKYDAIFEKDPQAANLFLLLCEIADRKGRVNVSEEELADLMAARFEDPARYAL